MKKSLVLFVILSTLVAYTTDADPAGGDAIETTSSGIINWTAGEIFATGIGVPPAQPGNVAQARAMAERAAFVVALRNLLEAVKGVRVDSESVVENYIVKSDVIRTRVDGLVRGARIVNTKYLSDGSVEVQVGMQLRGALMDALLPESFGKHSGTQLPLKPEPAVQPPIKPEPTKPSPIIPAPATPENKPEPVKPSPAPIPEGGTTTVFKGGVATGLVIDGTGLNLRPALLPKIIDANGQEIYVGQIVTRTNAVDQGVAGYAKDVNAATNNFRVTDNPAIIKGIRASGTARTDIVVGQDDAQTLRLLSSKGNFLQYCRVIIVY
jgi:hypothetical protein